MNKYLKEKAPKEYDTTIKMKHCIRKKDERERQREREKEISAKLHTTSVKCHFLSPSSSFF